METTEVRVLRSVKMPPGIYFLGDPVQALDCDDYDQVLEESNDFRRVFTHGDSKLVAFHTSSREHVVSDEEGGGYRVASGLIGLVPAGLVARKAGELARVGRLVQFDQPVRCSHRSDGVLTFGQYRLSHRS